MSRGIKHVPKVYDGFKNIEDREEINPKRIDKRGRANER